MKDVKQFADFLKISREKVGLTQADVARSLGYSTAQFVSNWERGLSYPPLKSLRTLAKIYKVNIDDLFNAILT
jgi:transcriptional regulator with XRE-family HTH domain